MKTIPFVVIFLSGCAVEPVKCRSSIGEPAYCMQVAYGK
jgi:hypothetical protein